MLGSHPIGTAVGGVAGAVAAGAAAGSVAGPVGAVVGAAVGAAVGALAGKVIADMGDPEKENEFWRQNWLDRHYTTNRDFDYEQDWGPAYRYGVDAFISHPGVHYDDIEHDLSTGWPEARGESRLGWDSARHAARDAWHHMSAGAQRAAPGKPEHDGS